MLWHRCTWLPTESSRTRSFCNRSTLFRCVTAHQTSHQNNKAQSDLSLYKHGEILGKTKGCITEVQRPLTSLKTFSLPVKVYCTFCCLMMNENHSASSKTHISETLAKNVFHRRRETVLRRRWMLFMVI